MPNWDNVDVSERGQALSVPFAPMGYPKDGALKRHPTGWQLEKPAAWGPSEFPKPPWLGRFRSP
ncbi:MAG: hypothetical protein AAGA83_20355 [Cyanobacteria bacterium P01_F01_bin.116]